MSNPSGLPLPMPEPDPDKAALEDADYEIELVDRLKSQCGRLRYVMVSVPEKYVPDGSMPSSMALASWAYRTSLNTNPESPKRLEVKRCDNRRQYGSDVCTAHDTEVLQQQLKDVLGELAAARSEIFRMGREDK